MSRFVPNGKFFGHAFMAGQREVPAAPGVQSFKESPAMIRLLKVGLAIHAALEFAERTAKVRHGIVYAAGVGKLAQ